MRASAGIAAAVLLLLLPANVGAADREVVATSDNVFEPADVTVAPGDTVTFRNTGGDHNVRFEDGGLESPPDPSPLPWTASRKFETPGNYRFYCELHGGPGGVGMSGVIKVPAPGAPDTQAPTLTSLDLRRAKGKGRAVVVVLRASEGGTATVTLYRKARGRFRKVRGLRKEVEAGKTSIKIKRTSRGRRLKLGRYRVVVRVTDAAGNRSRRYRAGLRLVD